MSSALEDIKTIKLDKFLTLATAPSPTKLMPGQTPNAYNTWVDEKPGSAITANGLIAVGALPSGNPGTFSINYFQTTSGTQTFVVSDNATVWTTVDFQNFTAIITGLSPFFQLRGAVIRDKLWLTNGSDAVREFDGTTVTVLDGSGSTPNVPRGRYIAYHDERVWLGHISSGRSLVYFSALTDSSANIIDPDNAAAWPSDNNLQVSEGDADFLTGMILYRGYLHFFKQYSIWRLVGYDEYSYTRVKTRASTGTRFNESLQIMDSLVQMIGIDGLYVFDGEETDRISDLIDPSTAEQTSFGFNQLQQPNTNNQFWEVSSTADYNAGSVPSNLAIGNQATLQAADNTQADFQAGPTQTNIDLTTNVNSMQLALTGSGVSGTNVALSATPAVTEIVDGFQIGVVTNILNGGSSYFGINNGQINFTVTFPTTQLITRIIIRGMQSNTDILLGFSTNGPFSGIQVPVSASLGSVFGNNWDVQGAYLVNPTDIILNFTAFSVTTLTITLKTVTPGRSAAFSHLEAYQSAYYTSGQFVSRTLDLLDTPNSNGNFFSDYVLNGEGLTFYTQTSADGVTWDSPVLVANGGAIGSTPRRYIRWVANFSSDGLYTPVISDVWVGTLYKSAVHNTGGNIYGWGAFESPLDGLNGQTINFYYRGATTAGGIVSQPWNFIVPGAGINLQDNYQYIQFKFEILGYSSANAAPFVDSVTMNWITGVAGQQQTYQNVASFFWKNRYWLSAAGASATANNTVLIRGKKTFQSPWQLKDWNILSFCRFFDSFYGTSSVDGTIYQLDVGYSKNGQPLNSIFETGDFSFEGFQANIIEMLIETERMGPYTMYVGTSVDQGNTWTDHAVDLTPTSGSSSFWKIIRNLNITTDKIRLRFYTNANSQPWQVHNAVVFYKMSSNRGTIN